MGTTSWRASSIWPALDKNDTPISTTRVLHMSDCARCRQPLEGDGRWNVTFGGWSHQACRGRAVWPPLCVVQPFEYNPLIALRKMASKEAFAGDEAQTHIQALMVIVGREFVMPRPRQRQDSRSSEHDRGVPRGTSSTFQASTAPLVVATSQGVATIQPEERKRRQPPPPTPKGTPSPPPKNPRANEQATTAQESEHQQPTTSKPTTPRSTRKDNKSPAKELQPEPKREFQLQTAVKAGGGKFVHDVNNDYGQYRKVVDGFEYQFTIAPECEECFLGLVSWAGMYPRNQTICLRCRTRTNRSRKADSAICTWRCPEHGIEVGTCCIPVVLRTRLKEST